MIGRLVAPHIALRVETLQASIDAAEARAAQAGYERGRAAALTEPLVFGPPERIHVASTARINDALLNTTSGEITIAPDAFFGHRVALLTGTHDIAQHGLDRQRAIPDHGRDVHIGEGVWVGTGAIVLGPCRIGAHSVVAAGAVVTRDVEPETVVAGVPARIVRRL